MLFLCHSLLSFALLHCLINEVHKYLYYSYLRKIYHQKLLNGK